MDLVSHFTTFFFFSNGNILESIKIITNLSKFFNHFSVMEIVHNWEIIDSFY